jgi:hypothetical protein
LLDAARMTNAAEAIATLLMATGIPDLPFVDDSACVICFVDLRTSYDARAN